MGERPLLSIQRLSARGERRGALEDVSLSVAPGSVHALIGPNGGGKTTLLSAVLGLVPFAGKVTFSWRAGGRIGFVPQSFAVDRTLPLTVAEFLAVDRQLRPVCLGVSAATRKAIGALLERVGLAGGASKRLGALSGGELRRVLLAHAIDPAPEVLLLDEPGAGLDQRGMADLEAIIASAREEHGTTVLIVSHDIAQVRRLADAVTWVERTVRASGPPREVLGDGERFPFAMVAG